MRSAKPMRGNLATKRIDTRALERLVEDGRMWVKLGRVFAPDGRDHYKIEDGSVLVEVETIPDGCDLTCRLGTWGSGGGFGAWTIPRVGTIVAVLVPDGVLEFSPIVIGVLDCNAAPSGVSNDLTLVVDDRPVAIECPALALGDKDATHPIPLGDTQKTAADALADAVLTFAGTLSTNFLAINPIGAASALATLTAATLAFRTAQYLSQLAKVSS